MSVNISRISCFFNELNILNVSVFTSNPVNIYWHNHHKQKVLLFFKMGAKTKTFVSRWSV